MTPVSRINLVVGNVTRTRLQHLSVETISVASNFSGIDLDVVKESAERSLFQNG
jgi:hypothetical protein